MICNAEIIVSIVHDIDAVGHIGSDPIESLFVARALEVVQFDCREAEFG